MAYHPELPCPTTISTFSTECDDDFECWAMAQWTCPHCSTALVAHFCERAGRLTCDKDPVKCPCCEQPSAVIYSATWPSVFRASDLEGFVRSVLESAKTVPPSLVH